MYIKPNILNCKYVDSSSENLKELNWDDDDEIIK